MTVVAVAVALAGVVLLIKHGSHCQSSSTRGSSRSRCARDPEAPFALAESGWLRWPPRCPVDVRTLVDAECGVEDEMRAADWEVVKTGRAWYGKQFVRRDAAPPATASLTAPTEHPRAVTASAPRTRRPSGRFRHVKRPRARRSGRQPVAVLAIVACVVWLVAQQPGYGEVAVAVALAAALAAREFPAEERWTVVLALGVFVASIGYLSWRVSVVNLGAAWVALPLIVAEIFGALHTLGLQYTIWPRREAPLAHERDPFALPIYVLIPTVDEGVEVLEHTLQGALSAARRYSTANPPARVTIVVCNDGLVAGSPTNPAVQDLCRRLGVECVTRTVGGGAKAGNLEHARDALGIHGDVLVAIFDADQAAEPDFFVRTIPPFADTSIGWVQTGQYYRNLDDPVARWANDQQAIFYRMVCPGKSRQNSQFICGTNVVLRADALDEIGGLPTDNVTEDFAASLRLHGRWRSIYLEGVLALGLGPVDLGSYFKQQNRWARGTLSLLSEWRTFLGRSSFTVSQRIQYALSCTHYLCGVRDLVYVLSPAIFLIVGTPAVVGATLADFLEHFLPYLVTSQVAFWLKGRGMTTWRGIVIGFGSFPALVGALMSVALRKRRGFVLTPKQRVASSLRPALPHLVMAGFVLVAILVGLWLQTGARALISLLWLLYTLAMLGAFLTLALGDGSAAWRRESDRVRRWSAEVQRRVELRPVIVGPTVAAVAAAAVVLPALHVASAGPTRFDGRACAPGQVAIGLHAEGRELRPAQSLLKRRDVVGKTVEVAAGFPRAWAERVAQQHALPWVTLDFGLRGRPTLTSSLLSISNGLHDTALERWAGDARAFGHPMLVTVLPAVDKNWAVSSAVANGGIPQDVAPAWSHIRALFSAARNVALVWAPADPINDQPYAPPANEIDAVQATWYGYRGARWPDPERTLGQIARRHPGKPIVIDVSAAGPASRKAELLVDTVHAAARRGAIVTYHEGGPFLRSAPGRRDWSLTALTPAQVWSVTHAADSGRTACTVVKSG